MPLQGHLLAARFFNLPENKQIMPKLSIDKMRIKYFVQIFNFLLVFQFSKCPTANLMRYHNFENKILQKFNTLNSFFEVPHGEKMQKVFSFDN